MPPSPPSPEPTGPRRRAVLAALAASCALAATGCGADLDELRDVRLDDDPTFPPPSPGPDELARRQVAEDAARLHDAALAAGLPGVAGVHAAHLEALGEPLPAAPPAAPTIPPQAPAADLPAAQAAAAVTALGWLDSTTGGMARLLASVAAGTLATARQLAADLGQPAPEVAATAAAGSGPVDLDAEAAAAVSAALRGEHAAVYGFEVVAARAGGAQRDAALGALEEHERAADELAEVLEAAGRQAPVPEPGYVLPAPARSPAELQALAVHVEERTAGLHGDVVAAAGGPVRLLGADLLLRSALRAAAWRGGAVALPGLP